MKTEGLKQALDAGCYDAAIGGARRDEEASVSYTHLRAHETVLDLVCRLLLEKKKTTITQITYPSTLTNTLLALSSPSLITALSHYVIPLLR